MLKDNGVSHKVLRNDKKLIYIERMFDVPLGEIKKIIREFHSEMRKGLSGCGSSLKMIPTCAERPKGTEKGDFLALDLGGTNFRVLLLKLKGKRITRAPLVKRFVLKKEHITGEGRGLFAFLAGCIKVFMDEHNIPTGEKHDIGFAFSFPVENRSIDSGVLARWTKGFSANGVEGRDVVKLLNESLAEKGLGNTKVVAIVNDAVGTLVTKSYEDPDCDVGVIIGTGTNACYCERLSNILKWRGPGTSSGEMLVNIEWGNFNKLRLTPYDRELDGCSENPGEQLLEKKVSGMYLGELARLVIKDSIKDKSLFAGRGHAVFNKAKNFTSEYISIIESDKSKHLSKIDMLLRSWGIADSEYGDRAFLKKLCSVISTRAARISAAVMASVVTKIDPQISRRHTIAIDGSLYEKHPGFSGRIKETLEEIFYVLDKAGSKPKAAGNSCYGYKSPSAPQTGAVSAGGIKWKASPVKLSLTKDGSGKGAAIIAAHVAIS